MKHCNVASSSCANGIFHSYSAVPLARAHRHCSDCSLPINNHRCLGFGASSSAVCKCSQHLTILTISRSVVGKIPPSPPGDYLQTQANKNISPKPSPPPAVVHLCIGCLCRSIIPPGTLPCKGITFEDEGRAIVPCFMPRVWWEHGNNESDNWRSRSLL